MTDLTLQPQELFNNLVLESNPQFGPFKFIPLYPIKADDKTGETTMLVTEHGGATEITDVEVTYTRIDLKVLFSLIKADILNYSNPAITDKEVFEAVTKKYHVTFNGTDFIVERENNIAKITATINNPVYYGAVDIRYYTGLSDRVINVILDGLELPGIDLAEVITIDSIDLYKMPPDYVEGKRYATCLTMGHDFTMIYSELELNKDGKFDHVDVINKHMTEHDLPIITPELVFKEEVINLDMDGVLLTKQFTSQAYQDDTWAGTIIIRI